jgi:hypothetical protein
MSAVAPGITARGTSGKAWRAKACAAIVIKKMAAKESAMSITSEPSNHVGSPYLRPAKRNSASAVKPWDTSKYAYRVLGLGLSDEGIAVFAYESTETWKYSRGVVLRAATMCTLATFAAKIRPSAAGAGARERRAAYCLPRLCATALSGHVRDPIDDVVAAEQQRAVTHRGATLSTSSGSLKLPQRQLALQRPTSPAPALTARLTYWSRRHDVATHSSIGTRQR